MTPKWNSSEERDRHMCELELRITYYMNRMFESERIDPQVADLAWNPDEELRELLATET